MSSTIRCTSILMLLSLEVTLLLLSSSVTAMYSKHNNNIPPVSTTSTPPSGSQPIIRKLSSAEMGSTSQDINIEKSRKCQDNENCVHYFLFGCLCYPSESSSHFSNPTTGIYSRDITAAEIRARGFAAPSTDIQGLASRSSCISYCHGRDPCFCPFR